MRDDAALLRRFAEEKSEEAFAELVHRHLDLVYSTALRRLAGDAHLAQDVTQTVFTALARKAASLTERATLAGWLYLGAQHAAAQAVRGERRRRTRELEAHTMHELLAPDGPPAEWDRVRPVIDEAMRELNDADREAVLLRFFERRAFGEIGLALRVSEDAARMRVERALEKLRARLARRGVTSTAGALGGAMASQAVVAAPTGLAASVAGGAVTAAAATAAGFFMSTSTMVVGAVALLAGGAAFYQTVQRRSGSEELATLARERDGLRAQVRAAGEREQKSAQQAAALQRELEGVRVFKATTMAPKTGLGSSANAGAGEVTFSDDPDSGGKFFLLKTPDDPVEARRQAKARVALGVDSTYAALYRQLGWTAEQQEQFRELMYERDMSNGRLFSAAVKAAREKNPQLDRAGMYEIFEATNVQRQLDEQADVRRVFGDAMGQRMERYQTTLPMRYVAGQVASALYYTDTPLDPALAEQLIDLLAANARSPGGGRPEIAALNIEAAVAQARGLLSAAQLVELQRVASRMQEQARLERERNTAPVKPAGG